MKKRISLDQLGQGAALELFEAELAKVIANIDDPNTSRTAKRQVTLKVVFTPDKKVLDMCVVEIHCESKIAPATPFETTMFVGIENGEAVASEYSPHQGSLLDDQRVEDEPVNLKLVSGSVR